MKILQLTPFSNWSSFPATLWLWTNLYQGSQITPRQTVSGFENVNREGIGLVDRNDLICVFINPWRISKSASPTILGASSPGLLKSTTIQYQTFLFQLRFAGTKDYCYAFILIYSIVCGLSFFVYYTVLNPLGWVLCWRNCLQSRLL